MNDWWRSWHGAPNDPKWITVARKANVAPGIVVAVAWWLLDHASQQDERGDVATFDAETCADFTGFSHADVLSVLDAMGAKGIIISGRLAKWEKRQPRREDVSAERVRNHRRKAEMEPSLPLHDPEPPILAEKDIPPAGVSPAPVAEVVAAAPPVSAPMISPEAHALADQVTIAAGHTLEFIPPSWAGAAYRTQMWIDNGWRVPLILESVRAQMAHKRDGPPGTIQYFEKGILRAHAESGSPLPSLKIVERQAEVIHVAPGRQHQERSGLAAVERLRERVAAASAAETK